MRGFVSFGDLFNLLGVYGCLVDCICCIGLLFAGLLFYWCLFCSLLLLFGLCWLCTVGLSWICFYLLLVIVLLIHGCICF